MTFIYTSGTDNYTTPGATGGWYYGPREHAWLKQRCAELGYSTEILYMHYYDNTVVSGYSIPGTYSSTVTESDSVSRVPVYLGYYSGDGVGRMLVNYSHPITRQLQIEYAKQAWLNPDAGHDWPQTSSWDGYYIDNWLANELSPAMGQIGSVTAGGRLAEHPTRAYIGSDEAVAWYQEQMHQFARELRDTLHNAAAWAPDGRPKYLAANIANTWIDDFADPEICGIDYLLQEFQYSPIRTTAQVLPKAASRDSASYANGSYTLYSALQQLSPSNGEGSVTQAEALYGNLAYYYVTRSPNTYLFQMYSNPSNYWIDQGATSWDTLSWRGCMDYEIGPPLDRYSLFGTGTDPAGWTYTIYQREYADALVMVRPITEWNADITPETAVAVQLPVAYQQLNIDGSLGSLSTTFSLRNGGGLILIKPGGGQSYLIPPLPFDPANGEIIADQNPLLYVNNAQDSESRSLAYEFQLDGDGDFSGGDLINSISAQISSPSSSTTAWDPSLTLADGATYYWRCRVSTTSGEAAVSEWSTTFSFTINLTQTNNCPTAPTASAPAANAQLTDLTPFLEVTNSSDPDDDQLTYGFVICTDAGMTSIVGSVAGLPQGTGNTGWTVDPPLTAGQTYYWYSRSFDGACYSGWSSVRSFSLTGTNQPPPVPVAISPTNEETVVGDLILTVQNVTDAESDQVWYQFLIYDGATIIYQLDEVPEGSGSTTGLQPDIALTSDRTYSWRVQCHDPYSYSGWSDYNYFYYVENSCPPAPGIDSPANGTQTTDTTPVLRVTNSNYSTTNPLIYDFDVATDVSFSAIVASATGVTEGSSTTQWTVSPALSIGRIYYWRARAVDGDCAGGWSATTNFGIPGANTTPPVPVGISPLDEASVSDNGFSLVVDNVDDPQGDPIWFQFMIYRNGQAILARDNIPQSAGQTTTWQPNIILDHGVQYSWRVQCHDPYAYSGWTGHYYFSASNQLPDAPELYSPGNADTLLSQYVVLALNNVEPLGDDEIAYEFQVYSDPALNNLVGITDRVWAGGGGRTSWLANFLPENGTMYWWRARAVSGLDVGPWSATWSFLSAWLVVDVEGQIPSLIGPLSAKVNTTRPQLSFRSDPEVRGESCEFVIAVDPEFQNLSAYSGIVVVDGPVVQWTPRENLVSGSTYYWRVHYLGGEWSETAMFTIQPDVHFAPNPFPVSSAETVTLHNVPAGAEIRLYSASGNRVATLVNDERDDIIWDVTNDSGEPLAPGVYHFTVTAADLDLRGKFVVAP